MNNDDKKPMTSNPQRLNGVVVSAGKMTKTVTVLTERLVWHKKLRKQFRRSKKYLAHDPKNEARLGDKVVIEKCGPISARKNFRVISRVSSFAARGEQGEKT